MRVHNPRSPEVPADSRQSRCSGDTTYTRPQPAMRTVDVPSVLCHSPPVLKTTPRTSITSSGHNTDMPSERREQIGLQAMTSGSNSCIGSIKRATLGNLLNSSPKL